MADPISFTASVLTLLAAAGGSCKFLYNFVLDIQDTPVEIQTQTIKLRCLHQTISNVIRVYDGLPQEIQLESHVRSDIVGFIEEIENIKTSVHEKDRKLNLGRMHHWKEKLKWLSYDRQITKFYSSLDQWEKVFLSVASTINTYVTIQASFLCEAWSDQKQAIYYRQYIPNSYLCNMRHEPFLPIPRLDLHCSGRIQVAFEIRVTTLLSTPIKKSRTQTLIR